MAWTDSKIQTELDALNRALLSDWEKTKIPGTAKPTTFIGYQKDRVVRMCSAQAAHDQKPVMFSDAVGGTARARCYALINEADRKDLYDQVMNGYCSQHPTSQSCTCPMREKGRQLPCQGTTTTCSGNPRKCKTRGATNCTTTDIQTYEIFKNKLNAFNLDIPDQCWFEPCKNAEKTFVPSSMWGSSSCGYNVCLQGLSFDTSALSTSAPNVTMSNLKQASNCNFTCEGNNCVTGSSGHVLACKENYLRCSPGSTAYNPSNLTPTYLWKCSESGTGSSLLLKDVTSGKKYKPSGQGDTVQFSCDGGVQLTETTDTCTVAVDLTVPGCTDSSAARCKIKTADCKEYGTNIRNRQQNADKIDRVMQQTPRNVTFTPIPVPSASSTQGVTGTPSGKKAILAYLKSIGEPKDSDLGLVLSALLAIGYNVVMGDTGLAGSTRVSAQAFQTITANAVQAVQASGATDIVLNNINMKQSLTVKSTVLDGALQLCALGDVKAGQSDCANSAKKMYKGLNEWVTDRVRRFPKLRAAGSSEQQFTSDIVGRLYESVRQIVQHDVRVKMLQAINGVGNTGWRQQTMAGGQKIVLSNISFEQCGDVTSTTMVANMLRNEQFLKAAKKLVVTKPKKSSFSSMVWKFLPWVVGGLVGLALLFIGFRFISSNNESRSLCDMYCADGWDSECASRLDRHFRTAKSRNSPVYKDFLSCKRYGKTVEEMVKSEQ